MCKFQTFSFKLLLALVKNEIKLAAFTMSKAKHEIKDAPGLEDIRHLFPPSASPSPIANFSMKLPPFWPDVAEVWFTQAETKFTIRSITVSKTKFYYLVAVLPQEVTSQILDLICAPPAGDP